MKRTTLILAALAAHGLGAPLAPAQEPPAAATQPAPLTVAVLDFAAATPGEPQLGAQIAETLTVMLSGEPGFTLVDRAALLRMVEEQALNLSGVVDTQQAIRVGQVVGARIMIVGKAFILDRQLLITAKLIGVETSLVEGVLVKGDVGGDVGDLIIRLAAQVAQRLRVGGPKLVAREGATADPLPALKARLAGLVRPVVAVVVPERHAAAAAAPPADPAVETELKRLLLECGFPVQDVKTNTLTDFARTVARGETGAWPRELAGVDVVIAGQGLSEYSARIGNLISCAARVEINLVQSRTGRIELAERTTERAVDLSEHVAAKRALEKAGRTLGLRVLEHFAATLPPAAPAGQARPGP